MNDILITCIEQQKDIKNSFVHLLKKIDKTMENNTELLEKFAEKLSILIVSFIIDDYIYNKRSVFLANDARKY
jgi:hypothetical protein